MIIDCIGCLHGHLPELKGGDLLIVTGDLTKSDGLEQQSDVLEWLHQQDYKKKVLVAGNHDLFLQKNPNFYKKTNIDYLCDSGTKFDGVKIWGSPWTSRFIGINPKCTAFTVPFGSESEDLLLDHWDMIPADVDILVTHSPPYGILDGIPLGTESMMHVGSHSLYNWLKYVGRPRLHVFSHIHEAYGKEEHFPTYNDKMMLSVNCSIMNERYRPVNAPVRVVLTDEDLPACR